MSRPSCTRRRRLTWGHASATWTKRRMAKARPAAQPPRCAPPPSRSPSPPDGTPYWSPPAGAPHAEGLQATQCGSRVGAASSHREGAGEEAAPLCSLRSGAHPKAPTLRLPLSRRGPTRCGSRRSGRWWASPSTARSSTCCSTCPPSGPTARRSGCSRGGRSFNPTPTYI